LHTARVRRHNLTTLANTRAVKNNMIDIKKELFALGDEGYREFTSALSPTVEKGSIIGVRLPILRKLARRLKDTEEGRELLRELPHTYYEEYLLHLFLVEFITDFDRVIFECERVLPYLNSWSLTDSFSPKILGRHKSRLLEKSREWLNSAEEYTRRFGILQYMRHFLDEDFREEYLSAVASSADGRYYVDMAVAWYFATALVKAEQAALPYYLERRLPPAVHKMAVRKALDSFRVRKEIKDILRKLSFTNKV